MAANLQFRYRFSDQGLPPDSRSLLMPPRRGGLRMSTIVSSSTPEPPLDLRSAPFHATDVALYPAFAAQKGDLRPVLEAIIRIRP